MKIVLATPLFPPEITEPAPYVKELAKRLGALHEVTVVAYTHLPEEVSNVRVVEVDKRRPLLIRLIAFTRVLWHLAKRADIVYAMNGASVELPALLVSYLCPTPFVFALADPSAHERARSGGALGLLERHAFARTRRLVRDLPPPRPEILPLEPRPTKALAAYDAGWAAHERALLDAFSHAH